MKVTILAKTRTIQPKENLKDEFDNFSGKAAGICYMPNDISTLFSEEQNKTDARIRQTKSGRHLSVYDHAVVSLYFEDIPKILAMIINNEKMYNTSEKSARYTKMNLNEKEQAIYNKWIEIFKQKISQKYQNLYPDFFTKSKIQKLAQENARYLISVFTPTCMLYTVPYGQLNKIYHFLVHEFEYKTDSKLRNALKPYIKEFCQKVKDATGLIDDELNADEKNRVLSLFDFKEVQKEYGSCYATTYKASFAQLAQAQRHRTLWYSMKTLDNNEFYVPKIIRDDNALKEEWLLDCKKQESIFPQGMLVQVNELGTLDNFILKMKERKCTFAQLEINNTTDDILTEYVQELGRKNHPQAEILKKYTLGSRCTFEDYKCISSCGFKEGVIGNNFC